MKYTLHLADTGGRSWEGSLPYCGLVIAIAAANDDIVKHSM